MKINEESKYWELYYDYENEVQCIATHWSDECSKLDEVKDNPENVLKGWICDNKNSVKINAGVSLDVQLF